MHDPSSLGLPLPPSAATGRSAEIPRAIVFSRTDAEVATELVRTLANAELRRPMFVFGRAGRETIGRSLIIDLGAQLACRSVDVASGSLDEAACVRGAADDGGCDVAKYAAFLAGLPFVAMPTQASHDGMSSPVAVLTGPDGGGAESHGARPPAAVVVPMHVVRLAPRRALVGGIADLAVNVLAVADWQWAARFHGDPFDDYAALLARSAAELMVARRSTYTPEVEFDDEDIEILIHGLILSGLAMTLAGSSRPCSGSEHLISHAFDRLEAGHGLHGEQVAVGAVVAASLYEQGDRVLDLLRSIGAPQSPTDIGIDRDTALKAIRLAPTVRPGRHSRLSAALAADEAYVLEQADAAWFG